MVNSMDQAEQTPSGQGGGPMRSIGGEGPPLYRRSECNEEEEPIKKPKVFIGGVYSLW